MIEGAGGVEVPKALFYDLFLDFSFKIFSTSSGDGSQEIAACMIIL